MKRINAYLSNIFIMENFTGVIKQIRQDEKWKRGGILIANHKEQIENSVLAHKLFPNYFPKIIPLANDTYLREFINSPTLEDDPKNLSRVIEMLFTLHKQSIGKLKGKKNIKISPCGDLWEKGYYMLNKSLNTKKKYSSILTYNMGDAKASNLLTKSKYLTFDSEGFGIGDISTDIISLIEGYQFNKKEKLFKETLTITKEKYLKIDKDIIEKCLLGLVGIRAMEVIVDNHNDKLLKEAIKLFDKYRNI